MAEKEKINEAPVEKPPAKSAPLPKPVKPAMEWRKALSTPLHVYAGALVRARIQPETGLTQAEYERAIQGFLGSRPDGRR